MSVRQHTDNISRKLSLGCHYFYQKKQKPTFLTSKRHQSWLVLIYNDAYDIFREVAVAKLMYAFNAWWGFSNANDRHKTFAFIRRCIHTGFCSPDLADFHNLYISSDEKLFNQILTCYVMFSGVVLKIKVGIRYKHMWTRHRRREDRGAERGGV